MDKVVYQSLSEAYQQVLIDVLDTPQYECAPRGSKIKEILGYEFEVDSPADGIPIVTADGDRNMLITEYTNAEIQLYNSLTTKADDFARASSFWKKIANPDGTINSAYGNLIWGRKVCGNPKFEVPDYDETRMDGEAALVMRTPWDWAMLALRQDKDTRQSIIHFNTPDVLWLGNKDVVCTLNAQFFIREDKLHMFVEMRSNDVVLGLVYDCVWFSSLMHRAVSELRGLYPDLTIGRYSHYARSMHIYERHFDTARRMIGILP